MGLIYTKSSYFSTFKASSISWFTRNFSRSWKKNLKDSKGICSITSKLLCHIKWKY